MVEQRAAVSTAHGKATRSTGWDSDMLICLSFEIRVPTVRSSQPELGLIRL